MTNKQNHPDALEELLAETKLCCYTCSYPLKGLKANTCPECGSRLSLNMFIGWGIYRHRARGAMTITIPLIAGASAFNSLLPTAAMIWAATTVPPSLQKQAWPFIAMWGVMFIINAIICACSLIQRKRIHHLNASRFWTLHITLLVWLVGQWSLQLLITNSITQP